MMQWARDRPHTDVYGGVVPCVKAWLRGIVRDHVLDEYRGSVPNMPTWEDLEGAFEEAFQPLDDHMVILALRSAHQQIRQACRVYEAEIL